MEPRQFDRVVRSLAEGFPRRTVLKGLLAAIAGGTTVRSVAAQALPIGEACVRDLDCESNICSDGYCCDDLCIDNCEACNVPGSEGTCSPRPFGSEGDCPPPSVCRGGISGGIEACCAPNGTVSPPENCCSGFAPQNVCCDTACDGPCDTCIADGSFGTCTTIPGCGACDDGEVDCGQGCVAGECCVNGDCASGVCCDNTCCPTGTVSCDDATGTCVEPGPDCVEAGQECDENSVCCNDLQCIRGICGGPECIAADRLCSADIECCDDLICEDGTCAAPCLGAGESCDSNPNGCCGGLVCTEGVCGVPANGDATVTIHAVTCPTGVGGDIFESCHDNVLAGVGFVVNGTALVTGGNGVAATNVETGPVSVAQDAATFAAYLGAYVYCAEQGSGTVLFDGSADSGSVSFTVGAGDDVVCDWYNITLVDDDDDDDDKEDRVGGSPSKGTSLPQTGIGSTVADSGETFPWLGSALLGGAAAIIAGKRLRDETRSPETSD